MEAWPTHNLKYLEFTTRALRPLQAPVSRADLKLVIWQQSRNSFHGSLSSSESLGMGTLLESACSNGENRNIVSATLPVTTREKLDGTPVVDIDWEYPLRFACWSTVVSSTTSGQHRFPWRRTLQGLVVIAARLEACLREFHHIAEANCGFSCMYCLAGKLTSFSQVEETRFEESKFNGS